MEYFKSSRQILAEILTANAAAATATPPGIVDRELESFRERLGMGTLKFQDATIYSTVDISLRTQIKVFETSQVESKGIINITAAKLGIDQLVLVTAIRMQAAVAPGNINGNAAVLGALNYGTIVGKGDLTGGTWSFRQQNKNEVLETSLRKFVNTQTSKVQGVFTLHSPLLLRPQQLIELNIELGKAAPDRTALRVELLGTQTAAF